jgi:hypothetical protein
MFFVKGPRRSGKTTTCALAAKMDPNVIIVTSTNDRAKSLIKRGVPPRQVCAVSQATSYFTGLRSMADGSRYRVVVDELPEVLSMLLGMGVEFATLTPSSEDMTL